MTHNDQQSIVTSILMNSLPNMEDDLIKGERLLNHLMKNRSLRKLTWRDKVRYRAKHLYRLIGIKLGFINEYEND